jgi:hypothetical protein
MEIELRDIIEYPVVRQQFTINDNKFDNENEEILSKLNELIKINKNNNYYSFFAKITSLNLKKIYDMIEKFTNDLLIEIDDMNFEVFLLT